MKMPPIWRMSLPWVMFVSYLLFSGVKSSENNTAFSYYHGTSKFNHLAVDQNQGAVFIGAVNHLYILSPDLKPLGNVTTAQKRIGENYNKILVVNSHDSQLIACGAGFWCEIYNFNSSSLYHFKTFPCISAVTTKYLGNASAVAFISKFHQNENERFLEQHIYFAVSYGEYSRRLPATTIRTLNFDRDFRTYTEVPIFHQRSPNIPYREASLVNYVYGFESGKYVYFLTTQKKSSEPHVYISKVIRICYDDKSQQHGYIEIPIECKSRESTYNLIQAVTVGKSNIQLAESLNISLNDDVLFAIFSERRTTETTSYKSSDHSALCIYSIKVINEKFTENICSCFNGNKCPGFKAVSQHQPCSNYSETVGSNLCSLMTNMSLEGLIPIIEHPVITFDALSTAITIKSSETDNDVFIGTNIGHLKKIVVNNPTNVCELADLSIDEGSPVNSDLLFSPQNDSLYIMTNRKLAKINLPIHPIDCSIHTDYRTCVHQNTPKMCGWCGLTNKCTTRCDCSYAEYYAWFPSNLNEYVIEVINSTIVFKINSGKSLLWGRSRLPAMWQLFTCEFTIENKSMYYTGQPLFRENENNFYNLQCPLPGPLDVPPIPVGTNHLNGTLSISTPQISNITKINIKLFDCKWYPKEKRCGSPAPKIIKFSPKEGPIFGGTELIIKGEQLNTANSVGVFIGNVSCAIVFRNSSIINCTTNAAAISMKVNITVKMDDCTHTFDDPFYYFRDLNRDENEYNQKPAVMYLLCIIILGLIILVSVFISSCFIYRRKYSESSQTLMNMQQNMNNISVETLALQRWIKQLVIKKGINLNEESSNILRLPNISIIYTPVPKSTEATSPQSDYLLPLDNKWEFARSKLTLAKHLGEGEFGKVFQGEASSILYENVTTTVAVKKLKDAHSDAQMIALVSEMEMMKLLGKHENVLCLLGCCTQDGDLLIITEYALHGNLRDFLRKYLSATNEESMPKSLSEKNLLTFAVQIASGMEYLASNKCIHRDVAARNVLVSEDYVMKIGDFGLARDVYQTDYYRKKTDGRLPVKWMAPEALCHSIYTTQSDIWSYGILLWEIMTLGGTPYPSFPDVRKLYKALHSGYRMGKPPNCSQTIYNLMRKCWSFLPESRPSFTIIVQDLEEMISESNDDTFGTCNLYRPNIHKNNN